MTRCSWSFLTFRIVHAEPPEILNYSSGFFFFFSPVLDHVAISDDESALIRLSVSPLLGAVVCPVSFLVAPRRVHFSVFSVFYVVRIEQQL